MRSRGGNGPGDPAAGTVIALVGVAVATAMLALFQWMELLLNEAGHTSFCSIDEVFDCEAVWQAPLAKRWQAWTGVPVAGWGLLWALGALSAALVFNGQRLAGGRAATGLAAVRMFGAAGVLTSVLLGGYSLVLGQLCLTCLATYALVIVYTALSFRVRGAPRSAYSKVVAPTAVGVVIAYLVLRIPGASTPMPGAATAPAGPSARSGPAAEATSPGPSTSAARATDPVAGWLRSLPPAAQQSVVKGLEAYRAAPKPALPATSPRPGWGPSDAPVQLVDFSDLKCGHCARLAEELAALKRQVPAGSVRIESRYFPLDGGCNPHIDPRMTDPSQARCVAPKVLICSQRDPDYETLRQEMFRAQAELTGSRAKELAVQITGQTEASLEACIESAQTERALLEDIEYALRFDIQGTPMTVLDGKKVMAFPPLLMALVLARGNPSHPGFAVLSTK